MRTAVDVADRSARRCAIFGTCGAVDARNIACAMISRVWFCATSERAARFAHRRCVTTDEHDDVIAI